MISLCHHLLNIESRLQPHGLHPCNFYGKNVRGLRVPESVGKRAFGSIKLLAPELFF